MFLLQMSGFPGSGKSTLAKWIAQSTNAVVIDHDVVKTALLASLDSDMDPNRVGGIAYSVEWSLIDFHLSQGHHVVHDSPCLYDELVDKGTALAKKHTAKYKYVECVLENVHEVNKRLTSRQRMVSQIHSIDLPQERFKEVLNRSKKPDDVECLRVDTSQPIDEYIGDVLLYLHN
ncbi:AAA family ATPase [Alicyclobacillus fodiniaquatilis]|jgi:predicted kinase|uniref:AAA family ATPase n=1 Tax=Alicyclobacillus fodiniaquatilis TaxID=1661150 RepID=A0ABW4JR34_9BACL